jgi:hypothetical protein
MGWLDKLRFWRRDDPAAPELGVEGCFTLPGAELDGEDPVGPPGSSIDATCEAPVPGE